MRLPGSVALVASADGRTLATPSGRRVIDRLRPQLPASLGCVLDSALASDAVAVAADREGIAVVIVGPAVASCPALSRLDADLAVATVGAGTVDHAPSVLEHPRWARARPYLLTAPVAVALEHVIAGAQVDPLAAWLAIDTRDPTAIETTVRGVIAATHAHLEVTRAADQVVVRGDHLDADELPALADAVLALVAPPHAPISPAFDCSWVQPAQPQVFQPVVSCTGSQVVVHSLSDALLGLVESGEPDVEDGDIVGLRTTRDAPFALRRGDVLVAIDSHPVTSTRELVRLAHATAQHAIVVVRRDGHDVTFRVSE